MGISGDGFVTLADGSRRWGRFGAAGILARHVGPDGEAHYFVALRSSWTHNGGTWAVPGGALNDGETALEGALREFAEEIGHELDGYEVAEIHEDDHGGWSYTTLVIDVTERFDPPAALHWETAACQWVPATQLAELELFDAFRATLTRLGLLSA
jgi:8-oxo-dGTP pyrophosphatase MutT (NUDIX family)